jgi:hypothetical protein
MSSHRKLPVPVGSATSRRRSRRQAEVIEDPAGDPLILDDRYEPHRPSAPSADEHVHRAGTLHGRQPRQSSLPPGIIGRYDVSPRMNRVVAGYAVRPRMNDRPKLEHRSPAPAGLLLRPISEIRNDSASFGFNCRKFEIFRCLARVPHSSASRVDERDVRVGPATPSRRRLN